MHTAESSAVDCRYMDMALLLARRGRGHVEPNPMVGAVLVQDGKVLAKGWHRGFGQPHAEIEALRAAKAPVRGGTLYVNLEPCCHTGKTGPCTQAIIAAGIQRVVVAMTDPNPLVRGKGIRRLRAAGIDVTTGVMERQAQELNRPFITWITTRRPYITAKWAQTLDGCVADSRRQSRWISSPESRELVHQWRGRMDGIMVGIGTALADDPMLTARPEKQAALCRTALRIIMDSQCRLPLNSKLVQSAASVPVMVLHQMPLSRAAAQRRGKLLQHKVLCLGVRCGKNGKIDLAAALHELRQCNCTNILVEGGPTLIGALLAENLIDEGLVFIAPKIAGDKRAHHAVEGLALTSIENTIALSFNELIRSGDDVLLRWRRHKLAR
jgi:diaminohydroxyphosphoribosylaminopyrimidine deaminase/5-amino-6-(5-phosphoribosylamino)uracil reductase